MRRAVPALATVALFAAATAAAAATPLVPTFSQHEIKAKQNLLAYVPTSAPTGFRYYKWTFTPKPAAMRVWLRNKQGWEITFIASPQTGPCDRGHEKSFQLRGNKVWWSHTANEQQAWRCVPSAVTGKLIRLTAATVQPPTKFADVGIGRVAASGRWIR